MPERVPSTLRATLRLSTIEGALCAAMVGLGEIWFVPDAIRLGAAPAVVVVLAVLPIFVGAVGPLLMLGLLRRARARRPLVVGAVLVQVAALSALSALDGLGRATPTLLLALSCLYQISGQAAGTAWSSWIGEVVPTRVRGQYFARRTRFMHATTFAGLVAGGLLLQRLEVGDGGGGFCLIFALGALFRLVSAGLLTLSYEPEFVALGPTDQLLPYLRSPEGAPARRLLPLAAAFLFAVSVASPLFAPYMLRVIELDYLQYMASSASVVLVKTVFLPRWGRAVDRFGPKAVYGLVAVIIATIPFPWLAITSLTGVVMAQALSGAAWGGYEISLFALLLGSASPRQRPLLFAAHSVFAGAAQLAGGLVGALLFGRLALGYQGVFFVSGLLRLGVASLIPLVVLGVGRDRAIAPRDLLMRVVGFRAHGGLDHGPVADPPAGEGEGPGEQEGAR